MASGATHFSSAHSRMLGSSERFHSAVAGTSGGGGGSGGALGSSSGARGSSEQSVSLAPPAWATRKNVPVATLDDGDDNDLPQQGSTELDELEGIESLRESSVVVRASPARPARRSADSSSTPLEQALQGIRASARQSSPAPDIAMDVGATPAPAAWEFAQPGCTQQGPAAPMTAAAAAAAPTTAAAFQQRAAAPQRMPPSAQRSPQQQLRPPWRPAGLQRFAPVQPPPPLAVPAVAAAAVSAATAQDPLPQLAQQQPLPPGRYGWQRNPHLPEASQPPRYDDTTTSTTATTAGAAPAAPSAPSLGASQDSLPSSLAGAGFEGGAGALPPRPPPPPLVPQQQQQPVPPPLRPPSSASAIMHRCASSQQQLLPAEAAIYSEAGSDAGEVGFGPGVAAGGCDDGLCGASGYGSGTAKTSPTKSLDASAFHVEAFAGTAAAAVGAAGGSGSAQAGLRPSRTAALRKRHQAQLRRVDRDQYGVPVASSARPFSLWASPQAIGEACTGLGVYFVSVKQFIIAALLLCLVAIYPLVNNLTSQRWAASYTLVADQEPLLPCNKGWDTSSWVTGTTAGSRCGSSRYSSSFDCPSICTWSSAHLHAEGGLCSGLPPPALPFGTAASNNATCLLHPPCSAARSSDPTAPDGPCYCCELQLDPAGVAAASASAGPVPVAQLWVLLVGQLAFLIWVLFLTRSQLHAVHTADARVITASDYTVRLQGVPQGVSTQELQQWCSHYGSVVAAHHIPDVGDSIRVAQRLHSLQIRCAEADAWLASTSCSTCACCFNLWALGAMSRQRLHRAAEDAALELKCYQRQDLRPTGAALAVFEYAEHAANCIEDHHRSALRRTADALLCGATASAPRLASKRIRVDRAPEPSDILWENTSCTGSAALWRRLWSGVLTLLIMGVGAGVQYGLAVAGEEERKKRLSQLYRYNPATDYSFDFSSWAAFTASALEVTKLNAISILSGLAAVVVNWLVTVAARQLAVLERWHTRTAGERWALLKLSVAYLVNSFVVPLLAAYFAGSSNSWYSRGGLMESAFYMQLANALLPPLAVLCDLQEIFYFQLLSRSPKTQAMMDQLLQPLPFLLAEQYASALTTLGIALCWMPVLPISPFIAAVGLLWAYWVDKIVALRRTAHPGNMRGKLVSSSALIIRLLPLAQLLLMRFVYFVGEGAMVAVFWTGLAVWLLFAAAPLRSFLGLQPRRRSTVTGGMSYQETLGRGQRKGLDDRYEAELPPCCSPAFQQQVAAAFAPLPVPLPACETLLPGQKPATGGTATCQPFWPDRSSDRAVARAAASLRARQQALLSAASSAVGAGVGASVSRAGSGGSSLPGGEGGQHQIPPTHPAGAAPLPAAHHRRHLRQQSGGSGGGSRLSHTLSAVKDGLASGASWLWNTPNPDDLFSYDWQQAQEDDTKSSASAPPMSGQAWALPESGGASGMAGGGHGHGHGWGGGSAGLPLV